MSARRFRDTAGYSLVELIVMMSAITMVMSVAVSWIHASMKFGSAVKDRAAVHQQLSRLSEDLRIRIALCDIVSVDDNTMKLKRDGIETLYVIKNSVIERVHRPKSQDDAGNDRLEIYSIGNNVEATWGAEELPDWVSLTIKQKPVVAVSGDLSKSIGSLETPKLQFYLRAGPRKAVQ